MTTERPSWTKLRTESKRAYQIFSLYRDFGWDRSIVKVYRKLKGIPADQPVSPPGGWSEWSSKHHWTLRCDAFDAHEDEIERAEREKYTAFNAARIAKRQGEFEWKRQIALEEQFERIDAVLKKAEASPIVDVTRNEDKTETTKDGVKTVAFTKTKVKGINFSGYARLTEEKRAHAAEAGLGPRHTTTVKHQISGNDGGPIQHDFKLEFSDPAVARAARDFARTLAIRRSGDGAHPEPGPLENSTPPGSTK